MPFQAVYKIFASLILLSLSSPLLANAFASEEDDFLTMEEAYQSVTSIEDNAILIDWQAKPGYYMYQHRYGIEVKNDNQSIKLTPTFEKGKEKYDEYFQKGVVVYYGSTTTTATLPDISPPFEIVARSQSCADAGLCYAPRKQYFFVDTDFSIIETKKSSFTAKTAEQAQVPATTSATQNESQPFLPVILLGALLGGLILNLMPCVFPVLSLKALSFASSHLSSHSQHIHGWAYTAGVVISFVAAASLIIIGREAGESLGWGFQLQHPIFVAFMIYLFFVMGLSLSGLVEIGTSWMGAGQSLTSGHGLSSSFFTGVLAAVVASPCTAPFMASAIGFALTQPIAISLLVFTFLGLGMALPFLLLSYFPSLAEKLPAPGAWMDTLKQFLAFPLYATCAWLLWVLGHQSSSDGAAIVVLGGVLIAFGLWLLKTRPSSHLGKLLVKGLAIASLISAITLGFRVTDYKPGHHEQWQAYSPEKLTELRKTGVPVFIDLTADWCITCKFNERVALNTEKVAQKAEEHGIIMLQGNWTNSDPEISKLLEKFGRSGVPLYLMYPARSSGTPEVLPQLLSESIVLKAMEKAVK